MIIRQYWVSINKKSIIYILEHRHDHVAHILKINKVSWLLVDTGA